MRSAGVRGNAPFVVESLSVSARNLSLSVPRQYRAKIQIVGVCGDFDLFQEAPDGEPL